MRNPKSLSVEHCRLLLNAINEHRKVQVGKDQEKAQSEKDSHSKIRVNQVLYHENIS